MFACLVFGVLVVCVLGNLWCVLMFTVLIVLFDLGIECLFFVGWVRVLCLS